MKNDKKWEREADKYKNPNATFADKLANFWDYHKYHLLIGVFAFLAVIYLSTFAFIKEKNDYNIICVLQDPIITKESGEYIDKIEAETGEEYDGIFLYQEDTEYIKAFIESKGKDINGDGEVTASITFINISGYKVTAAEIKSHKEQIMTTLQTGDCMILLADTVGMDYLSSAGALEDLSHLSGHLAYENKAVHLNPYLNEKIGKGEEDVSIYIALRTFSGTLAQMNEDKKEDFKNAEELLINIMS